MKEKVGLVLVALATLIIPVMSIFELGDVIGVASKEADTIWKMIGVVLYGLSVGFAFKVKEANENLDSYGGYLLGMIATLLLSYGAFVGFYFPHTIV